MADATGEPQGGGETASSKGSSLLPTIIAIAILTLIAAAGGGLLGLQLFSVLQTAAKTKVEAAEQVQQPEYSGNLSVRAVPPIVTNLANPKETFVRIEASVVFEGEPPSDAEALMAQISGDCLAFLRTVTLPQIEGASGLLHLREDLTERARIRSEGRVRELIIQAMAVE